LRRRLLSHRLAVAQHHVLVTVSDSRARRRPRDRLLDPTVGPAMHLARREDQEHLPAAHRDIAPLAHLRPLANDGSPPPALGTSAAVLEWLDTNPHHLVAMEAHARDFHPLELEQ